MPSIILITGVMAAGKSTIVNGREEITQHPTPEAVRQLHLRYELGSMVARRYRDAGFTVVYKDVILAEDLPAVVELLRAEPLHVVVLCPSTDVVSHREATRGKTGYGDWTIAEMDASLRQATPRIGYWLDTSVLTIDATVERILADVSATGWKSRVP